MTASASIPPTPHPTTPSPSIWVVWESVPKQESGYATILPSTSLTWTRGDRYSRLTWWQMPLPGGTARKFLKDLCAHLKRAYLSLFLWKSSCSLSSRASSLPA